jgi:hypothetical protein
MLGALIGGGLGLVGSIIGGNKADDAAQAQVGAADRNLQFQQDIYDQQKEAFDPFLQFGTGLLPQLGQAMNPIDREATLAEYYQSPEYQTQSRQARGQQLAASEATGGLGSTSTGNALASIAPTLGQNYLSQQYAQQMDQFNKLMQGAGMGMNAAGMQSSAAGALGSGASQAINQMGAAQAGGALAQGQAINQGLGAIGGMLSNPNIQNTIGGFF